MAVFSRKQPFFILLGKKRGVLLFIKICDYYVVNSFAYGGESEEKKVTTKKLKLTPFLFDAETKLGASTFEVFFINRENTKDKIYNYGFSLDSEGIVEEWLNCKSKTSKKYRRIFYRDRHYLLGKYGAIPSLSSLDMFKEN